ncbi:hypothetical protein NLI96_g10696 [Meripilus lineatus]|uniref:Uncharacterized protein n=1 Tax=Meripilus lineatus TaxID=2056292 RepID=A0AAD5UTB0_9APHY|nr:hypothetical protein NLI96_g10696 [Physisporinus lineatus]
MDKNDKFNHSKLFEKLYHGAGADADLSLQYVALNVINAAIGLSLVSDNTTSTSSPNSRASTHVDLIVGVTVAAIVVLLAILVGLIFWRNRRGHGTSELHSRKSARELHPDIGHIEPFLPEAPSTVAPTETPQHLPPGKVGLSLVQTDNYTDPAVQSGGLLSRSEVADSGGLSMGSGLHSRHDTPVEGDTIDPSRISQLIRTLNQALARNPLVQVNEESPPAYSAQER